MKDGTNVRPWYELQLCKRTRSLHDRERVNKIPLIQFARRGIRRRERKRERGKGTGIEKERNREREGGECVLCKCV